VPQVPRIWGPGRPQKSGAPGPSHFGDLGDHKGQPSALGSFHLSIVRVPRPSSGFLLDGRETTKAGCPRSLAFGDLGDHKGQPSALGSFHLNIPGRASQRYAWHGSAHFEAQAHSKQNQNKTHIMNALHQYIVQFQRILQKMLQFSATLCLQNLNSQQPIPSHALSTIQRPQRNAHL